MARVLEEVCRPEYEGLPLRRFLSDACVVEQALRLHELLWDLLVVDLVFPLDLHLRIEELNDLRPAAHLNSPSQVKDPLPCRHHCHLKALNNLFSRVCLN